MALQALQPDLLHDEEFAEVRAFLADRGLQPDDEAAILAAIRDRGWDLKIDGMPGDWSVKIREHGSETPYDVIIAHESDRRRALLEAVDLALSWVTSQQHREAFDRVTRQMMGMPGEEFIKRWDAGELSADDPHVAHLIMLRPVGW